MSGKLNVHVSEITFSGGQSVSFNKDEKVIIVGPNNSGKSQTLREIIEISSYEHTNSGHVVSKLRLNKSGTVDDLIQKLKSYGHFSNDHYSYGAMSIHHSSLLSWETDEKVVGTWAVFIKNVTAHDRLNICEQQTHVKRGDSQTRPQHLLYDNSKLMSHISSLFKRAFNKDIMFNYRGGYFLPIHVGTLDHKNLPADRVSDEYVNLVTQLPLLDKQGDGVKSYAGILFECIVNKTDILMIDEPEAFLHPPQMRLLGETLSSEVSGQLFVATHSSDILRGFLEGTKGNIKILRIQRKDDENIVHEIDREAVELLWSKPNLRYSNALDSLFHEQVIVCEDDSDCRLFNFTADYLINKEGKTYPDTCYIPSGGKHAIPGIVKALHPSGIPVKAIFDFDLISEKNTLSKTLDAFGCEPSNKTEIMDLWRKIDSEVTQQIKPIEPEEFKIKLLEFINSTDARELSKSKVEEQFKNKKPWNTVKTHGINGLPKGKVRSTFDELNSKLKSLGIFLIPVGEVENFSPETGLHGPAFVEEFLSSRDVSDASLVSLRDFVHDVYSAEISSIQIGQTNGDEVAIEMVKDEQNLANNGNLCQ